MSAPRYDSFVEFFSRFVIPRRSAALASLRLDGLSTGTTPHRPMALFSHVGHVWGVDGDTHFEPLEIAHRVLLEDAGADPFRIRPKATRLKIILRDDLDTLRQDRGARSASYLYAYARRPMDWRPDELG